MRDPTVLDEIVTALIDKGPTNGLIPYPVDFSSFSDTIRSAARRSAEAIAQLLPPLTYNSPILDLRTYEPNNVAHLIIDVIPLCIRAQQLFGKDIVYLFRYMHPHFRQLLETFGVTPTFSSKKVQGPVICMFYSRGRQLYEVETVANAHPANMIPDIYRDQKIPNTITKKKIFIARRGPRAIRNHSVVEALLKEHGYETIFMEDLSMEDQISVGANAEHIVAPHGAGTAFLVFNKNIKSFIEILPPHVYHEFMPVVLGSQVRKYITVLSDFDYSVPVHGYAALVNFKERSFDIDLELLSHALELTQ